ncbi:helix-hairpin-helix domain-containing protein [Clostridium sp. LIBA-8841]|uniref:helix-hairpin-helix domain-containing protein n=1 Tax=Clostridium sp. LIBA-8841 TaxID=2987530 RepID=UPI002AC3B809|nr:helix-hairpin-helix domain-containing protein [Clostridium sp. LIBA-8841]MDZ5253070.1 helix-hairpin-helix domain-containing protein [Clostridium sp. LIBA-8841]
MKKKEKIIGSLIIAVVAIGFLFVGYSKTNDKKISEDDMERLFLSTEKEEEQSESNLKETKKNDDIEENEKVNSNESSEEESSNIEKIVVEIKGEVKNPNVYVLENGSRIYELIEKAGGPTEEADLSNINRALYLSDGQCVVVRNINDVQDETEDLEEALNDENSKNVSNNSPEEKISSSDESSTININTASKETLMTLNGIGESKAQAIIDYREEIGGFKSVDEITNISGIGEKTLEKIKDKISIK